MERSFIQGARYFIYVISPRLRGELFKQSATLVREG
jgi:hypothetical protein